ncbi:exodeoxyribonuclease VII large subunit [Streptococcus dysgalactiae subsp. equisimilis]|uniref:exodeoxyribonuclease VII large subunit n=1 Tax=Streptococcus dysgalactiae TaxID=1334 RepID=UPI000E066676|nr:exodeoxyribonuclease VII large subunit [Streptococcus dysgalactiae]MCY7196669.1 exodeoxyribonuclease VII large subunit [Streptococcus dysgalactiae]MCY7199235.1 exodeoxyribonuclease VII large subunit [Streptococcus dysgalactiae]QQC49283.1 exodeoxyribonuclease VII large subunit [Streptococcus dysgalactiae]TYL05205.1 exodeoxyribonuclease VII large subunit [Streptococcus dysgalactiae]SUN65862.1 exodeoxyribonuclease VII large subunit [Streptococcus dysgalactiae subsp. equisimilis]
MADYLTVTHLTKYLKLKFDRDPYLERVYLTGQVSNFRKRPTHQYFSLKDESAVIQATMWAGVYKKLGFDLEEGMKINVIGRVQLYEPSGSYSIVIEKAEPDGIGALALQFEQLKKKLTAEGYFEQKHKQLLPQFVSKIGVITSPSGAVIRDIITTVSRRFPGVEILLFPTKVQGDGAAQEVVANIRRANQREDLDLLIVGRGGGSIEDLWAFNEEIVVQAIFESKLPVISSVGHETDTTLADFVADRRAATPTAAAELATPITKTDLMSWIVERQNRSYQACLRRIKQRQEWVNKLSQSVIFRQPERLYDAYLQKIDRLSMTLMNTMKDRLSSAKENKVQLDHALANSQLQTKIERYQDRVATAKRLLMANMTNQYDSQLARFEKAQDALLSLDTGRIIARGYAMIEKNQALVASVSQITKGDQLTIKMRDGQLDVEVKDVKNENI